MKKHFEIINTIIEYEIYLSIIFMFLTKGEAIRNILLFSAFTLWLATLPYRENKYILKEPVSLLFWGFIATILLSVIFSIDPLYSFKSLRGEPLKSVMLFCLLGTVLSTEQRLKRVLWILHSMLIFTLAVSYYSYFAHDLLWMHPDTSLRHANPSRLALDINMLIPFSLALFLTIKSLRLRTLIVIIIFMGILALMLSSSKGGFIAFLSLIIIWSIYFSRKKKLNIRFFLPGILLSIVLLGSVLYEVSPGVQEKISRLGRDLPNISRRVEIWAPLLSAAIKKPVFGWGYGSDLFVREEPFENTPYKVPPVTIHPSNRNPHNAFLSVVFYQGFLGAAFYITLLVVAASTFWRASFREEGFKSSILIACSSILISSFIVHALTENSRLTILIPIIGIGLAAKHITKNPMS